MKLMLYPQETNQEHEYLIYFLHIPKTGGTTLRDIISRQYNKSSIFTVPSLKESEESILNIDNSRIDTLKIIQGHLKFGIHHIVEKPFKYVTFLRDPIKRVISSYTYVLQFEDHPYNLSNKNRNMTIEELYNSGKNPLLINGQTQLISGITLKHNDPMLHSNELLEKAIDNIECKFTFVGLLEYFNESLLLMKRILDWKTPYYSTANRSRKRNIHISDKTIQFLKEHNTLDIKLYDHLKKRFLIQISKIEEQLNSFTTKNKLFSPIYSYNRIIRKIEK